MNFEFEFWTWILNLSFEFEFWIWIFPTGTAQLWTVLGRAPNGPVRVYQNRPNETTRNRIRTFVKSRLGTASRRALERTKRSRPSTVFRTRLRRSRWDASQDSLLKRVSDGPDETRPRTVFGTRLKIVPIKQPGRVLRHLLSRLGTVLLTRLMTLPMKHPDNEFGRFRLTWTLNIRK